MLVGGGGSVVMVGAVRMRDGGGMVEVGVVRVSWVAGVGLVVEVL